MVKLLSSATLGPLLAVALGVTGTTVAAAAETTSSAPETGQKTTGQVAKRPAASQKTAVAKSAAAGNAAPQQATTHKKTEPTTAQRKTGATKATAKPSRRTAKARRAAPASEEPVVVETALCYQRTAGRGRCEPQCLPYTRCRSGIASCRTGHENGPVTWFRCEQVRGNTSNEPANGRVLVLGRNGHGMPTGHTLYVEKVEPRDDGRYDLTLSHTNYDRRCNLEMNMLAEYDPVTQTIDVRSGKWERWGRELKVAGFIHN